MEKPMENLDQFVLTYRNIIFGIHIILWIKRHTSSHYCYIDGYSYGSLMIRIVYLRYSPTRWMRHTRSANHFTSEINMNNSKLDNVCLNDVIYFTYIIIIRCLDKWLKILNLLLWVCLITDLFQLINKTWQIY